MATAAVTIPSAFSSEDISHLEALQARFAEATKATEASRRERLAVIIDGFHLFQSYEGFSSEAAHEIYSRKPVPQKYDDAQKAAVAITGENPEGLPTGREKNRMYGRVRTAAGILVALQADQDAGLIGENAPVDELIDRIEQAGGWRAYGEKGAAGSKKNGGNSGTNTGTPNGTETTDGAVAFDYADWRRLIEQTGITAEPSRPILAPEPSVAFICGSEDDRLALMPLSRLPVRVMQQLQSYLPGPDDRVAPMAKAWSLITTALQLFDRTDSSVPLDPDVEPYEGQDMKPSLPGIICESNDQFVISASRQAVGLVISVALDSPPFTSKAPISIASTWVHGAGTNSLIRNLANPEDRVAYQDPELSRASDDSLRIKFKKRSGAATGRNDFTFGPKPIGETPPDYWLLRIKDELRITGSATFQGELASHDDLLKFAAAAGAKKSLTKDVMVSITGDHKLSLTLAKSKRNFIGGCSVEGAAASCDVRAQDFARALAFGQDIRATKCRIAIDPNGLLAVEFTVKGIGRFNVGIPTVLNGQRERNLLERVP